MVREEIPEVLINIKSSMNSKRMEENQHEIKTRNAQFLKVSKTVSRYLLKILAFVAFDLAIR